ncbi:hypothetical protein BDB01DRAFT_808046 [Pilobolus umbonatus]|nr:hypothetical protein BDB01DRAFT_808046 [Pilobolus umbonatus]
MYLPTEIIKYIGSYLSPADKGRCMSVCYSWYGLFLELLYTRIHIQSRHQFRLFYRTVQHSINIADPIGYNVKEISFSYDNGQIGRERHPVGISRAELDTFPVYFKYLESLDFDPRLWKYFRYTDTYSRFKHIRKLPTLNRIVIFQPVLVNLSSQLTYLSISGEATDYLITNNLTTSIWSKMPKLEELVWKGTNHVHMNVKLLIAIGAKLPRLKHITLACVSLPLNEEDLHSATSLPLFIAAKSLTLDDVHILNWKMLIFLNLAFSYIHTLDLDVRFDWFYKDNVTVEVFQKSVDACMGFAQLCLETVKFRKIKPDGFPFPYDDFFDHLSNISGNKIRIEMLHSAWWSSHDPVATFNTVTTETGLLARAYLLWSWTGKRSDLSLFKSLKCCPHLTYLDLKCDVPLKYGLRIDLLLDNCPQLDTLKIDKPLVTTMQSLEDGKRKSHRLHQLNLKHAILGDHLMDYIAISCPFLDQLSIEHCSQEKAKKSSFVIIRMPEHRFQSIRLNSLYLNPGGNNNRCEVSISILSFYESSRYENQNKRKQSRQKLPNEYKPTEMWRFYHVHRSPINKSKQYAKQLRRLSTEETTIIAKYEMTDKKWKAVRNATRRPAYQRRDQWEKDIPFGAVLLLCKSVKKLEFNEIIV